MVNTVIKYNKVVIVVTILLTSCTQIKKYDYKINDSVNAIKLSVIDYYKCNNRKINSHDVFNIVIELLDEGKVYHIKIHPENNLYSLSKNDTIGAFSDFFPTNYIYYKDKLFVWNDKLKPISNKLISVLHDKNKLDSIKLKYELGIYSGWDLNTNNPDPPMVIIQENLKSVHYIRCKNNILNFRKVKTSKYLYSNNKEISQMNCYE